MKHRTTLAPAAWAHHSWLGQRRAIRSERAARAANACLLMRFPELADGLPKDLAPVYVIPRPAFARLCRTAAALAYASQLRTIISAPARQVLVRELGPGRLRAIQLSRRASLDPLPAPTAPDWRQRAETTAMGLLLSMRAQPDPRQRLWLRLRLPVGVADAAGALENAVGPAVPADAAAELMDEAHRLMRGESC
jgi:hypothetical protein